MVEAQKAVKEYDKAINAYVACIQLERNDAVGKIAKPGEKPTPDQKKAMDDMERVEVQKHNAASISCKASLTVSTSRSRYTNPRTTSRRVDITVLSPRRPMS